MEYGEDSYDETVESSESFDDDDNSNDEGGGRSYNEVDCPKVITLSEYGLVNTFIKTISNQDYYEAKTMDLLESLNCTMNSPEKLEFLVHRLYAEASKWAHYSHLTLRFAKICKHCCCMSWIYSMRRNKTFEEILVERISEDFYFSESHLRRRISYVLKGYKGPDYKKMRWLSLRMKEFQHCIHKGPENMEFIHALFLEWVLIPVDLHSLIEKLLDSPDNSSMTLLCNLLENIGKDLDLRHHRIGYENKNVPDNRLDPYFSKMQKIVYSDGSDICNEVRDKLQDIANLRRRRWAKFKYLSEQ